MKKTITIYELLGLIKDGKAPKKIKYSGIEYNLIEGNYVNEFGVNILKHLTYAEYIMTHKVEIIEETKKLEKISWSEKESLAGELTANEKQNILARRTEKLKAILNELIDEINNLREND